MCKIQWTQNLTISVIVGVSWSLFGSVFGQPFVLGLYAAIGSMLTTTLTDLCRSPLSDRG